METQTRLSRHNKFISAENIIGILSVSSDDSLHVSLSLYIYIYKVDLLTLHSLLNSYPNIQFLDL